MFLSPLGVRQCLRAPARPLASRLSAVPARSKTHAGQLKKKDTRLRIILTQTAPGIGEQGEELVVRRGYARNFLFPQKLALYSTPETQREYAEARSLQKIDFAARARNEGLEKAQKRLGRITLEVKRQKVQERLHAPVDPLTIAAQLWRQYSIELAPEKIKVEGDGLTSFGAHTVKVVIGQQGELGDLSVVVVPR